MLTLYHDDHRAGLPVFQEKAVPFFSFRTAPKPVRVIVALSIVTVTTFYLTAQMVGDVKLVMLLMGIPYNTAGVCAGLVVGTLSAIGIVMVSPNMTYPDKVADAAKMAYTKLEKEITDGKVKPEAMEKTLKTIEAKKAEESKNRGGTSFLGLAKPLFPLKNPGIVSIPLGFIAAILAALAFPSKKAEDMWDEIYVRQNTGLGMAKAIDH